MTTEGKSVSNAGKKTHQTRKDTITPTQVDLHELAAKIGLQTIVEQESNNTEIEQSVENDDSLSEIANAELEVLRAGLNELTQKNVTRSFID